jgi:leucyl-tRNA---protein transferase
MTVLQQFLIGPESCSYLPSETSLLEYEYVGKMTASDLEIRLNSGWRKFGRLLFHPICAKCQSCRPVRIDVARFTPNRSQIRCFKQNSDLEVSIAPPIVDEERLDLYHRYHTVQEAQKGWPETERTQEEYAFSFVENLTPALEITIRKDNKLLAVVLTDMTPNLLSGTYTTTTPSMPRAVWASLACCSASPSQGIYKSLGRTLGTMSKTAVASTIKPTFAPVRFWE